MTEVDAEFDPPVADTKNTNAFVGQINYVKSEDPLNVLLLKFKEQIASGQTPTAAEQKSLIAQLQRGSSEAAKKLLDINGGLISAVAYPYKEAYLNDYNTLMSVGEKALLDTATAYSLRAPQGNFADLAVQRIDRAFRHEVLTPLAIPPSPITHNEFPMPSVYRFMNTIEWDPIDKVETHRKDQELKKQELQELAEQKIRERQEERARKKLDEATKRREAREQKERERAEKEAARQLRQQEREDKAVERLRIASEKRELREKEKKERRDGIEQRKKLLRQKTEQRELDKPELRRQQIELKKEKIQEALERGNPKDAKFIRGLHKHKTLFSHMHLPDHEISEKLDLSVSGIHKVLRASKDALGVPNRASLALMLMDIGVVNFKTRHVSESVQFSDYQREILSRLHMSFKDIAEELGVSYTAVNDAVGALRKKMNARSRTEMVIMSRKFNLGPKPDDTPEYLKMYSKFERQLVPYLHLENNEAIMEATGRSRDGVSGGIGRMMMRSGVDRRRQLALLIQEQGYEFDIKELDRPLNEIFTEEQMLLALNLDKQNDEIMQITGITVTLSYHISQLMKKVGARSRTELLLIAHKYNEGQFKKTPEKLTKAQLLASKLGGVTLNRQSLDELLDQINPREKELIVDYYFSPEDVSWRHVSEKHELGRTLSMVMARHGLMRIKKMLDAQKEDKDIEVSAEVQ